MTIIYDAMQCQERSKHYIKHLAWQYIWAEEGLPQHTGLRELPFTRTRRWTGPLSWGDENEDWGESEPLWSLEPFGSTGFVHHHSSWILHVFCDCVWVCVCVLNKLYLSVLCDCDCVIFSKQFRCSQLKLYTMPVLFLGLAVKNLKNSKKMLTHCHMGNVSLAPYQGALSGCVHGPGWEG